MHARSFVATAALLLLTLAAAPALAQRTTRSTELFKEGRAAMDANDFASAKTKLEESYRLDPAAGTLLNLAVCEENLGLFEESRAHFREVKAKLPPSDDRVGFVDEHLALVEGEMPHLTIRLAPAAPPGTVVTRDGAAIASASLGVSQPVAAGAHKIVVTAPGRAGRQFDVDLAGRETKEVSVEPGAASRTAPIAGATTSPSTEPRSGGLGVRTIAGIIVGSAGVVSLGAGIATGVMVLDRKSVVEDSCHGTSVCDSQEGIDASSEGATLSIVSTVTFITGLVAIGGGIVLIATDSRGGPKPSALLVPFAGPGAAGLSVQGAF